MRVKFFILFIAMLFATVLFQSSSFAKEQEYIVDQDHSTVDFSFKSTLHAVQGRTTQFSGKIVIQGDNSIVIEKGKFVFDVMSMDTREPKRDANMRRMLEVDKFSSITFDIPAETAVKDGKAVINGILTIRDVELPVTVAADIEQSDERVVLTGEFPLSLKTFLLKPPSVMKLIRVFDTVKVNFKAVLIKKNI